VADVKFCGLTRAEDARAAVALGAAYCGVIFAGGPRQLTVDQALAVLPTGTTVKRAAVFGDESPEAIADSAARLRLDVVQLHADPTPATIEAVRRRFGGAIWATVRCVGELPAGAGALFEVADAVLLDAKVAGAMGGTGTVLPWGALARTVEAARGGGGLVLAGGLTPENVGAAIQELNPDVVDVSSGVERAPGIKDQERMRRFVAAAHRGDSV
jgi:phosphoribosylanthranilate isomerase